MVIWSKSHRFEPYITWFALRARLYFHRQTKVENKTIRETPIPNQSCNKIAVNGNVKFRLRKRPEKTKMHFSKMVLEKISFDKRVESQRFVHDFFKNSLCAAFFAEKNALNVVLWDSRKPIEHCGHTKRFYWQGARNSGAKHARKSMKLPEVL